MADETLDIRAIVARIDRDMAEAHKLRAEQNKLAAERDKLTTEQLKLSAEQFKLAAEGAKFNRELWQIPIVAIIGLLGVIVGYLLK